jgi:oligogalacturonide lyase
MSKYLRSYARIATCALFFHALAARAEDAIPDEFKDPGTGARMLHLSKIPNKESGVIYFTQPCITPDSRYAVVRYLDSAAGHTAGYMYRYDFKTGELLKLTDRLTKSQAFCPKSGNLYYMSDNDQAAYVTNIFDQKTSKIADMPKGVTCANLSVNADDTLLVGTGALVDEHKGEPTQTTPPNQGPGFGNTFNRHDTNLLLSTNIKTGEVKELHRINTWLGHTQFAASDPNLFMFCHEGPWAAVDRIWTMRIGDAQPQLVHKRTEVNEIAGHEVWSTEGTTAWFDHNFRNTPSKHFLEGKNISTGEITRYPIAAAVGSIHYTQSPDGKFFVGDGGKRPNVAEQAMYILIPEGGKLRSVNLCSMAKNNYTAAEPNPHLTPDQHWAIFTATFYGTPQAYAVELPKEFWR